MIDLIPLTVLIIDDHPMTVESYVSLLSSDDQVAHFYTANDCYEAFQQILKLEEFGTPPSLALIDVNLPPFAAANINSGIDLALIIRHRFPTCSILMITMHKEPVWVNQIFKSINPEGFISKNDVNFRNFPDACKRILAGEQYYSDSIKAAQRIYMSSNLDWDQHDSKILQLLAEGKKTINLPGYISLSLSTIEKRKANLKKQLILNGGSDQELIDVAKELGLI